MRYIFNVADAVPHYQRITTQLSQAAPGKTLVFRNGVAMVVQPDGVVRDLRSWETADSPWCQATLSGDVLVYDSDGGPGFNSVVVMFRLV
ncbi:MAG: hypothetical protein V4529_17135 [Gemmatimonadota bacterium]